MPQQNQTENNQNQQNSGNWFLPAVLGAAIGGAVAYFFAKQQPQRSRCRSGETNSTSTGEHYEAASRGCCAICQDDYAETKRLSCGHVIHKNCYDQLQHHAPNGQIHCPMCRCVVD